MRAQGPASARRARWASVPGRPVPASRHAGRKQPPAAASRRPTPAVPPLPWPQHPQPQRLLQAPRQLAGLGAPADEVVGAHRADDRAAGVLREHQALQAESSARWRPATPACRTGMLSLSTAIERPGVSATPCAPRGPKPASSSTSGSSRKNTMRGLLHSISCTRCGLSRAQALMPGQEASRERALLQQPAAHAAVGLLVAAGEGERAPARTRAIRLGDAHAARALDLQHQRVERVGQPGDLAAAQLRHAPPAACRSPGACTRACGWPAWPAAGTAARACRAVGCARGVQQRLVVAGEQALGTGLQRLDAVGLQALRASRRAAPSARAIESCRTCGHSGANAAGGRSQLRSQAFQASCRASSSKPGSSPQRTGTQRLRALRGGAGSGASSGAPAAGGHGRRAPAARRAAAARAQPASIPTIAAIPQDTVSCC